MSENQIIEMTDAYLIAYKRAFEKTKNPDLAVQVAMSVIFVVGNCTKNDSNKNSINPMTVLLSALMKTKENEEDKGDPEEN